MRKPQQLQTPAQLSMTTEIKNLHRRSAGFPESNLEHCSDVLAVLLCGKPCHFKSSLWLFQILPNTSLDSAQACAEDGSPSCSATRQSASRCAVKDYQSRLCDMLEKDSKGMRRLSNELLCSCLAGAWPTPGHYRLRPQS